MIELFAIGVVGLGPSFETDCATCEVGYFVDSCLSISVESTILNCEVITDASGSASGYALEAFAENSVIGDSCPPFDGPATSTLDTGFISGPSADFGIMNNLVLSVGAAAGQPQDTCGASFGFMANLQGGPGSSCQVSSSASGSLLNRSTFVFGSDGTTNIGQTSYTETGSAGFKAEVQITASAPLQVSTEVSVTATFILEFIDSCTESEGDESTNPPVGYSGEQIGWVIEHPGTGEVTEISGVIGFGSDGSVVLLGDLDDPGISVVTGAMSTDVTGTLTFPSSFSSGGQYGISETRLRFPGLAGDLNNNSIVTPGDRALAVLSSGTMVGDQDYLAAVDSDLDGTVTAAESSDMVNLIDAIIGCRPDLAAPEGVLNFFDINAFNAAFANLEILADWNEDGLINFFDVSDYLAEFNAGCP